MPHIAVLFAEGFEEIEALAVVDVLRRAEVDVTMVGIDGESTVSGAHGVVVAMDALIAEIGNSVDGIVLPGGLPGSENLASCEAVLELVRAVNSNGGLVSAICAAAIVLEEAGVLGGRRFTCYPGFEERAGSGRHTGTRVEIDGNIITGVGPGAAIEFGLAIVTQLVGEGAAEKLAAGMMVVAD